jgi:DNA-binding SARP family transcriptional activator
MTAQPQARDRIAALLWPELGGERARGALRRTLSALRSSLKGDELKTDSRRVALADDIDVDVRRFRSLLAEGRLEDAVASYTGDFLSGFSLRDSVEFDEWQAAQDEALRGELSGALERLALGNADSQSAIGYARRWLSVDPLHEPAHRAVMRLLARAGDRSGALRQYRECARLLDRELGVAPLPETTALRDAIERGDELVEAPSPKVTTTVHETVGDLYTLHGDYGKAIASYESAAAAVSGAARAALEHKLANVHHRRGQWEEAERHYRAALRYAEGPALRARVSADWSLAVHRAGRQAVATRLAREALSLADRAKDDRALAQANNLLGILTGDREYLERGLALAERIGDVGIRVAALNNLALACGRAGDLDRAIALTEAALTASRSIGDRHREAALHNNLADLHQAAGHKADAMRELKRAVTLFAEIGEPGAMEPEIWKLVQW